MVSIKAGHRERRDRRDEVIEYIKAYERENDRSPSIREITRAVGLKSPSSAYYYVKDLDVKKKIVREARIARSTRTSFNRHLTKGIVDIAGLGTIVAGEPIHIPVGLKISEALFSLEIPESYVPAGIPVNEIFALKVIGDSMRDAMIHEGDIVLIYKTNIVHNGDIVAAWLTEEATTTLKRIRFVKRGIWLEPENTRTDFGRKRFFLPDQIDIQGKVIGVVRLYH